MWTLGIVMGMVVYMGVLVFLGLDHWVLDFRAEAGHPMGNDLVLYVVGLVFSGIAGGLALEVWGAGSMARELKAKVRDLENISFFYFPVGLAQKLVDKRLSEIASLWFAPWSRLANLNVEELNLILEGKVLEAGETDKEKLRSDAEHYLKVFHDVYDHAQRVFGHSIKLKERRIMSYVPPGGLKSSSNPPAA